MCGIAGLLVHGRAAGDADERSVRAALARLRHRGPDDEGVCASSGLVLGHRRLSILDLTAAGHQPMRTGDGRFVCSLNGEIYNYLELRAELARKGHRFQTGTDTEVLLAAFAEWDTDAIVRFRGQFAVAIWDAARGRLVLARDRVGEKPLHYWRSGDRFAFASEIKALLELIPDRPGLVPDAVDTYLHYQYVIEPDTLLEGVRKLPAGSLLEIAADRLDAQPSRYWTLAEVPPLDGDPVERMRAALDEAVALTLRSDAAVGVALSGGLDSGLIAAMAARRRADLTAFTVGYPGHRDFDERDAARGLAASLGVPWFGVEVATSDVVAEFPRMVEMLDEPIADVAAYGHYSVSKLAASHGVKVLLTGIGGDELFFGYGWVRRAVELSRRKIAALAAPSAALAARARVVRALLRTPVPTLLVNHRLPQRWKHFVDRQLDPARLDLERPDEWVFYQLDYHWDPAVDFTASVFTPDFRSRLTPRNAYRLMSGMTGGAATPEIAIASRLFDSWLVSNCLDLGDRVSMASSVEARVPLLEAGVIDAAIGLWRAGHREDAQGHKTWLRAVAAGVLPADYIERPKLGFVTPTVEWTQAVNAKYSPLVHDGLLTTSRVIDGDRLRTWLGRTRPGIRRDFLMYKLTLLELWCRSVGIG